MLGSADKALVNDAPLQLEMRETLREVGKAAAAVRHLADLLGLPPVTYAHVPLVLGPTGRRLAKRDGAVTLADQRALGRSPADVCGLLAHSLGLLAAPEPCTPADLVAAFDPSRLPSASWRLTPPDLAPA